ncbi:hypothetical protein PUN28_012098 [Cardiocondyla obscurior]|uniref:Uncharacterized protein n=1 Tax=Cardiocondyla obscurior TaxID=286306 RepID=A0AAW2FEI2_9HYME
MRVRACVHVRICVARACVRGQSSIYQFIRRLKHQSQLMGNGPCLYRTVTIISATNRTASGTTYVSDPLAHVRHGTGGVSRRTRILSSRIFPNFTFAIDRGYENAANPLPSPSCRSSRGRIKAISGVATTAGIHFNSSDARRRVGLQSFRTSAPRRLRFKNRRN